MPNWITCAVYRTRSIELDHKAVGVVEIGFLRGMFERPV